AVRDVAPNPPSGDRVEGGGVARRRVSGSRGPAPPGRHRPALAPVGPALGDRMAAAPRLRARVAVISVLLPRRGLVRPPHGNRRERMGRPQSARLSTPRLRGRCPRQAAGSSGTAGRGAPSAAGPRPAGAGVHSPRRGAKRRRDPRRAAGGALDPWGEGESRVLGGARLPTAARL